MESNKIKRLVEHLQSAISMLNEMLQSEHVVHPRPETEEDRLKELTELRLLARSDAWPVAVDEQNACDGSEEEKLHRAAATVSSLVTDDIIDKSILDYGCDEGHLSYVLSNLYSAKKVVGFETGKARSKFDSTSDLVFTDVWNMAAGLGPFDIIIANDVLDHGEPDKHLEAMKRAKSQTGKIFVRCHPWCSRHGAHLQGQLNRAYLHLVFSEAELLGMGLTTKPCLSLINPLESYRKLFKEHGLTVLRERVVRRDVDLFFTQTSRVLRRIKDKWQGSSQEQYRTGAEFPHEHMSIEFVNYVLI